MKVSKYQPVYVSGKVNKNLPISRGKQQPGVYIIKKSGSIVYVGHSKTDVYKTMLRHFQKWNDKTQERATFDNSAKVRIVICTPAQAVKLERALIIKHKPVKNRDKMKQYEITDSDKKVLSTYDDLRPIEIVPF